MKRILPEHLLAVAAVLTSIVFASCGKVETTKLEPAPAGDPVVVETPAPEPEPEPIPEPEPEPSGLEAKLNGYWAPDKDGMLEMITEAIAQQTGGDATDPATMAMATQMVEAMLNSMVASVQDGKSTMYSPQGTQESTYSISDADEATGEFTMTTTDLDGTTETATCKIEGDKLSLSVQGQPIALIRVDEAEFEKRLNAIETAPAPGLPPGIPAPTPPPAPAVDN